ncbi:MAG TPA: HoxN/HupN/NixA family nickel/cobalt transporter [Gaiellaceae bacterium]|nr:HoxN/HupN/NixA family nickel/cobalt transporter [Gaiellaceae bacterium]
MGRWRWTQVMTGREWARLSGFGAAVVLLHVVGWGLFLYYSRHYAALAGLGLLAYTFGLRHAFDADHIAAIDNTTRKMLQQGKRPLGVGFFFSLGHSSVVFGLAAGLAFAATSVNSTIPALQNYGGYIGASVSGTFLWIIGILNLLVLVDIVRIFREMKGGRYDKERLEQRLLERGFMNRFFIGKLFRFVSKSWHMYPMGFLFGLGFDTASEVALLAIAAGVATHHVPIVAVLSLPIIFAAGMSLMDTADGAFMSQAYGWAFSNPIRKVYYNITVTSLSVAVALAIGTIELLQVLALKLNLTSGFFGWLQGLNFGNVGYGVVGLFVVTWAVSVVVWKKRRIEERWSRSLLAEPAD